MICPARLVIIAGLLLAASGCARGPGATSAGPQSDDARTLYWPLAFEPTSLDPAKVPDIPSIELLSQCFEGLVRFNQKNQLEPALARSWDISSDGKTYTFHLRTDVKFHNGRLFTASDVKYSWERALAPATASGIAANYLDGITGCKAVSAGKAETLAGVKVVDEHTLVVELDRPRAYFPGMISYPTGFVVCREAVEKTGGTVTAQSLTGTGPFKFGSYTPGQRLELVANDQYWDGKPGVDRIVRSIVLDPETAYNNFRVGRIDLMGADLSRYVQDRQGGALSSDYHVLPYAAIDYIAMQRNVQPVFGKRDVRQAILRAVDRQQILKLAYKGVGTVANGFLPPELAGTGPMPQAVPYDPVAARRLLERAGYPGGRGFPVLTLTVIQKHPVAEAAVQIVRANLRDNLGITVNVQTLEAAQYFSEANKRQLGFYFSDWIADYPDPQNFISTLFLSDAPLNRSGYRNNRFDTLCRQADAERDPARRASLYGQANAELMDDAAEIPLEFGPQIILARPALSGWQADLCHLLPMNHARKAGPGGN